MQNVDKNQMIVSIVSIIVPAVVSILSLAMTLHHDSAITKRKSIKERIDGLYLTFYQDCMLIEYPKHDITCFDITLQEKIDTDLMAGIHFASSKSQMLYLEYTKAFIRYKASSTLENKTAVDQSFKLVANTLMKEYSRLCQKIKRPTPPKLS